MCGRDGLSRLSCGSRFRFTANFRLTLRRAFWNQSFSRSSAEGLDSQLSLDSEFALESLGVTMNKYFVGILVFTLVACAGGPSQLTSVPGPTPSLEAQATSLPAEASVVEPQLKFIEFFGIY